MSIQYFFMINYTLVSEDIFFNSIKIATEYCNVMHRSTRATTVPAAGSDHFFHTGCPSVSLSVRPSQNFKIERKALPAGTAGWLSGSLLAPVLLCAIFM